MTATGYENQVLLGDCLDVLRGLPSDTFDSCVTDPPYGLGDEPTVTEIVAYLQGADLKTGDFMGKDWDIPSVPVWRELYRVLKPGAHVLTFGGTRTWDLISLGARAAGFEKRDTIGDIHPGLLWIQGQGMPKSTNVSKQIDKKKGQKPKVVGPDTYRRKRANRGTTSEILPSYDKPRAAQAEAVITEPATDEAKQWEGYGTGLKPTWEPIMIFRKPFKGTLAENVLKHGTGAMNIDACRVRHATPEDFEKHKAGVEAIKARGGSMDNSWKNSSDLSGASDVTSAGRWPPNLVLTHRPECQNTGSKKAPATSIHGEATAVRKTGTHAAAKGYLTVGREQPVKGFADADGTETVDAWECAPGCPVAELDAQSGNRRATLAGRADPNESHEHPGIDTTSESMWFGKDRTFLGRVYADEGGASRFYPQFQEGDAWECVEGCPVKALDEQSGDRRSSGGGGCQTGERGGGGIGFNGLDASGYQTKPYFDSGGASRFYPQFEGQKQVEAPFFYTGKATKKETSLDGEIKNDHPTKKPLKLMQWLVKLVTPKGGLTIDPYAGSGSTLHAAVEEGVRYTGIEKDPHAHEIASKRLAIVTDRAQDRQGQRDLFDLVMSGELDDG